MATPTYSPSHKIGLKATAAVTAKRFIGFGGQQCAAGAAALGVAEYGAAIGDHFSVITSGTALVVAGAPITASNTQLECDASGRAIPKNTGKVCGILIPGSLAAAAGDEIEILVIQEP